MKARERAAILVSVGMQLRNLFQAMALGGPMAALQVAEAGLGLLGTARGGLLSSIADEDLYRNWQCIDLPELPPGVPGGAAAGTVAGGPSSTRAHFVRRRATRVRSSSRRPPARNSSSSARQARRSSSSGIEAWRRSAAAARPTPYSSPPASASVSPSV